LEADSRRAQWALLWSGQLNIGLDFSLRGGSLKTGNRFNALIHFHDE